MKPSLTVERLAADMSARQRQTPSYPYILFLGRDCERAAGVPPPADIARQVFDGLQKSHPDRATSLLAGRVNDSDDGWAAALNTYLGGLSPVERYAVLQPFYSRIPVPQFYQDLALLVRAGYFQHIFTTNIDSLLEQALRATGFYVGQHYQVTTLGAPADRPQHPAPPDAARLIKLHGDLGQSLLPVTGQEIQAVLKTSPSVLNKLARDLILVGYHFGEHPPTEDWLRQTPGGRLWWVSSDSPDPQQVQPIALERDFQVIDGESGQPGAFFGELALRLLRLPVTQALDATEEGYVGGSVITSGGTFVGGDIYVSPTRPSDEQLELDSLRRQLRQGQEFLARLEQQRSPDIPNPRLETQIVYQRQQIADLQAQLLSKSASPARLMELIQSIAQSVDKAHQDASTPFSLEPDTLDYLHSQVDTVQREASKSPPNRLVLTGAIGALLSVVQNFGPEVVRAEQVGELSDLVVSFAGGRSA
jgi:SIR2-like domain